MNRLFTAFAWFLTLTSSPLSAHDVCLVNDSDEIALFTLVSGTQRFEKKLEPKTHEFISLAETPDDRVVIVQTTKEGDPSKHLAKVKVIGTKVLTEKEAGRWNFCYVHNNAQNNLEMELLGFVCLDVVPLSYESQSLDSFPDLKSDLLQSLKLTKNNTPDSPVQLRKAIWFAADATE